MSINKNEGKHALDKRKQIYRRGLQRTSSLFLAVLCIIGLFGLCFFLRDDSTMQMPEASTNNLMNGIYTSALTDRYADNYPLRGRFENLNSKMDTFHGFSVASGLYKDDLDRTVNTLKETAQANIPHLDPYIDENKPAVCLTFDDGPSAESTTRILDVLEQYNAHATFFVVGEMAESRPDQLQREASLGCEIGNHTYAHTILTDLTPKQMRAAVRDNSNVVQSITGSPTAVLRPPGGGVNDLVSANVGLPVYNWNVDTMDWSSRNADSIYEIATTDIADGDIILMHDLYDTTADAVERIVPELAAQGFQFLTLSEMAQLKGIRTENGHVIFGFNDLPNNWTDHIIHPDTSTQGMDTSEGQAGGHVDIEQELSEENGAASDDGSDSDDGDSPGSDDGDSPGSDSSEDNESTDAVV